MSSIDLLLFQVSMVNVPKKLKLTFSKLSNTLFKTLLTRLNFFTFNFFDDPSLI